MASNLTIFLLVEAVARHSHYVQKFTLKHSVIFYHLMHGFLRYKCHEESSVTFGGISRISVAHLLFTIPQSIQWKTINAACDAKIAGCSLAVLIIL